MLHRGEVVVWFRRIARGVGRFARRAAPVLRSVARVAAPAAGVAAAALLARRYSRPRPEETARAVKTNPDGGGSR